MFDLLGDPIPAGRGDPGRPEHMATQEKVNKVRLLTASGWAMAEVAKEIGISVPTLKRHYFENGRVNRQRAKEIAIREVCGRTLLQLDREASKGNVSAIKAIRAIVEKAEFGDLPQHLTRPAATNRIPALGKKAALTVDAGTPEGAWADILPGIAIERPN